MTLRIQSYPRYLILQNLESKSHPGYMLQPVSKAGDFSCQKGATYNQGDTVIISLFTDLLTIHQTDEQLSNKFNTTPYRSQN